MVLTWRIAAVCTVIISQAVVSDAYSPYGTKIPNGGFVLNPCDNRSWLGVGHKARLGRGVRNPFGMKFAEAGKTWTADFCNEDSDGDGKSNGVELGDPLCTWTKESLSSSSLGSVTGHPGICEPLTSEVCKEKNEWLPCATPNHHPSGAAKVLKLHQTTNLIAVLVSFTFLMIY